MRKNTMAILCIITVAILVGTFYAFHNSVPADLDKYVTEQIGQYRAFQQKYPGFIDLPTEKAKNGWRGSEWGSDEANIELTGSLSISFIYGFSAASGNRPDKSLVNGFKLTIPGNVSADDLVKIKNAVERQLDVSLREDYFDTLNKVGRLFSNGSRFPATLVKYSNNKNSGSVFVSYKLQENSFVGN